MAHQKWQTKFADLFSEADNPWDLEIVSSLEPENGWLETRYKGMAAFECSNTIACNNRWTSANGWAIFHYRLAGANNGRRGKVKLFLGGQKCRKCNDVFENAKWDEVNIEGAIQKLLKKVEQKFYGLNNDATSTTENRYIPANMTAPHQTHLCQLCLLGNCQYESQNDIESIASQLNDLGVDEDTSDSSHSSN